MYEGIYVFAFGVCVPVLCVIHLYVAVSLCV